MHLARCRLMLVALLALMMSCVGPNYVRPNESLPSTYLSKTLPKKTETSLVQQGQAQHFLLNQEIPARWWTLFHSAALNELIRSSIQNSPNIAAAQAALRVAYENAAAQRGFFYPNANVSFNPVKSQTAQTLTAIVAPNAYNYYLNTAQVAVSYTPDVFGGLSRQVESLDALARLQCFQREATYLTLTANVANAAIQEAALRSQMAVIKELIAIQTRVLGIFKRQLILGDVARADVVAQEAALAQSKSALPPLEKQLALERDLLNELAGRFPNETRTPKFKLDELHLPTRLPLSLPSMLVENRPDVRAAEEQLHSASAQIGVAIANRLPAFILGINNAGSTALSLGSLFQSETLFWNLTGIVLQPVFEGGTLLHQQRAAEAYYHQAAALYRATVLNAFQNVADALQAIQSDATALRTASEAEASAMKSLAITRRQLLLGDVSTLRLQLSEQVYLQAKLNRVQAQANRLSDTVALFQALGGGWWNRPEKLMAEK